MRHYRSGVQMRIDQTRQEAVAYWFALVVGAQEQARKGNGTDTVQARIRVSQGIVS